MGRPNGTYFSRRAAKRSGRLEAQVGRQYLSMRCRYLRVSGLRLGYQTLVSAEIHFPLILRADSPLLKCLFLVLLENISATFVYFQEVVHHLLIIQYPFARVNSSQTDMLHTVT